MDLLQFHRHEHHEDSNLSDLELSLQHPTQFAHLVFYAVNHRSLNQLNLTTHPKHLLLDLQF